MARRFREPVGACPFAPCTHQANIHRIEVGIAVVARPKRAHQPPVIARIAGVFRIDKPFRLDLLRGRLRSVCRQRFVILHPVPRRHIRILELRPISRHAQHQPLAVSPGCGQRAINLIPVVAALLGFDKAPINAKIGNRRLRVGARSAALGLKRLVLDGETLGPIVAFVQRVAIEPLEGRKPDSRVHQHLLRFNRAHRPHAGLHLRTGRRAMRYAGQHAPEKDASDSPDEK